MENIEILAVGTHPDIMKTILRLLNGKPGWHAEIAQTAAEAIASSAEKHYNIVLVCAGLDQEQTGQLRQHFKVPVVQHYGGGSGLLFAEVCQGLKLPMP